MKRIVLLLLGLLLALPQFAQERKYSTFYEQRATLFEELPVRTGVSVEISVWGYMTVWIRL